MTAQIRNGRWTRRVTWENPDSSWRTDIFKTVLADKRLLEAEFILKGNGSRIIIPVGELRRILTGGSDHYSGKIWGPFNIHPIRKTVAGRYLSNDRLQSELNGSATTSREQAHNPNSLSAGVTPALDALRKKA